MQNRSIVRSLWVTGLVATLAGAAHAQTLTALELKCQLKSATAEAKFVQGKFKCVSHCWYDYWHSGSMSSFADCLPPYGGETALCINDTLLGLKGVENKFSAAIVKACTPAPTRDCPECYSGGDCTAEAGNRVGSVEGTVDSFVPGIFCERATAMPQTQWCERGVAKVLSKLVGAEHKCFAKCQSNAFKGLVSVNACQPPPSDPTTATCMNAAGAKATAAIDKICNDAEVPHSEPACPNVGDYPDGATWTNLATTWTFGEVAANYCGSPSGAFVE
jgi:hypothetical protein